ncbi:MAG: hypothetical protein UX79_C0031G0004 [candidate division WWE3 bacterium GW2011_GWB1_47_11]|uniref:Peptidase A2 domain-containing protein n=2 Tax=Bacteria candidate phyla TaxID=1783234 RepID=A0A0G0RHP2_9BACT|nr:MAG: hypothetical protein UT84_C0030G0003 [Candidatus Curtissbacteria bacterium GW2011_GWA1_40_16]KKU56519.1 MAG: hypothetical protein UX79_C0031G0004 [candidate division WWE3 bacterium GW2011_GWB1_47_11]
MTNRLLISKKFPYIPIQVKFRHRQEKAEALLDTGFDGDIIIPEGIVKNGEQADDYQLWRLADGSLISAPAYRGSVKISNIVLARVRVTVLGNKTLVGRNVIANFKVTLDHGRRVIVE